MLYTPLNQIAKMLREAGVSQKKLAEKLDISETHLSRILSEKTEPSFKLYGKLCTFTEMYQLINDQNDSKINDESD